MKKNQIALIFLTLIVMLAVWYVKTPLSSDKDNNDNYTGSVVVSSRLDAISNMRDLVTSTRNETVANLDAIIASADTTVVDKENALKEKQTLSDLTEKEVILETKIMNMGYIDAFVHSTNDGVEVIIVSDTNDSSVVLDIIQNVMDSFEDTVNVVVNFKTENELLRS